MDLAEKFTLTRTNDRLMHLTYGDSSKGHGLHVHVDDGVMSLTIRAEGDAKVLGSGKDMVYGAMQRLDHEGIPVKAIRGHWNDLDSVNSTEYYANRAAGMSAEDAARNTWTGRIAADYGFTRVDVEEFATIVSPTLSK